MSNLRADRVGLRARHLLLSLLACGLLSATTSGCGSQEAPSQAAPLQRSAFQEVSQEVGIHFQHDNGGFGKKLFPEIMGSGGAFLDADGDGWLDLYLVNCQTLPGAPKARTPLSRFYHNRGNGTFEDQTERSGLGRVGYGMGVAAGDINSDGAPDLFVTAVGQDHLFLNQGNGTFQEITVRAGIKETDFGASAVFLDYNHDGRQDLYVCNYVKLPKPLEKIVCRNPALGLQYCDVHLYPGERDRLYRNNGDLTFTDVSEAAGITRKAYRGLAVLCSDYDGDGWVDIFVADDEHPMLLWKNRRNGTFTDVAGEAGIAVDGRGRMVAGMGLDMADLNRDGSPEFIESAFQGEPNILFQMESPGWFVDRSQKWDLAQPTKARLAFGLGFLDYDLDGWRDLIIANGHVIDDVQQFQPTISYAQAAQLFRNLGTGRMADTSNELGNYSGVQRVGRGAILGDYDNDGDVDVLLTNNHQSPALLRNQVSENDPQRHWLTVKCVGTKTARDGYGVMVEVEAGGVSQRVEVRAAAGYLGSNDPRVNFGLGKAAQVDRLSVIWPGNVREEFGKQSANQFLVVREGAGHAESGEAK